VPTTTTTTTTPTTTTTVPPGPQPFAADSFTRSLAGSLGTADLGGTWVVLGPPANVAVDGATGRITMVAPATGMAAFVPATGTSNEVHLRFRADKPATGGGVFASVVTRRVGAADYRAKVRLLANGSVQLILNRAEGSEVVLAAVTVPGLTVGPATVLRVRAQAIGTSPTTVRAKVWLDGTPEPPSWQLSATDSSAALQAPGTVGIVTYLSGSATNAPVTVIVDDLWAAPAV
jgi:hypothetical protein